MIISRTPFRISLFGGGTDFPQWYKKNPGAVISFTIDKYCYLSIRQLPPFFEHKYRVAYSKVETVTEVDQINHPAVREGIKKYFPNIGLEIHHDGDLPARSGIGSSSSFAVGLIQSFGLMNNLKYSKTELAQLAIEFEQEVLKENVGSQDQIACAFGGFNRIDFGPGSEWNVTSIQLNENQVKYIENNTLLVYTGNQRSSSEITKQLLDNFNEKNILLERNYELVSSATDIFATGKNLEEIGSMLDEYWHLKKQLNNFVSNSEIDFIYELALNSGALGGKLLGAGSGGFMLFWANENKIEELKYALSKYLVVPFRIDYDGSRIIYGDRI